MLNELLDAHARIRASADELEQLLRSPEPPPADILGSRRVRLSTTVREYKMLEDRLLIVPLRARHTAGADAVLAAFAAETAALHVAYSQHITEWPAARIMLAWNAYRIAARALLQALRRIIGRKDTVLFAQAERALAGPEHAVA